MSGNSIGKLFTVTTFGESHGPAYGCIVDGCPPGLKLTVEDIQMELDRRRPGMSKFTSQRREEDKVAILSGIFEEHTTGTPIGLLIKNTNQREADYNKFRDTFRPGHADFTYQKKYGIRDHRGGGRASARETVMRVAAGAIAKKFLQEQYHIVIQGYLAQIGPLVLEKIDLSEVDNNPFFCPNTKQLTELKNLITQLRRNGESIGARINLIASNMPIGLGEPVFDRLDADIAKALMSIPAVKGVEIGAGFDSVQQLGSEHRDPISPAGFISNQAGGILGGISTGQPILVSLAIKPTSSILTPTQSINDKGESIDISVTGRHDPCIGLRATPIAEAMLALVLMDHVLRDRAQNFEHRYKSNF